MKKIFISIALISVVLLSTNAQDTSVLDRINKKGELRVGMTGNQPPYTMVAKTGELIGYEVDLANILADYMQVELKLVKMPFAKLLPALESGKVDIVMSGMSITAKRSASALFASPYLFTGKSVLLKQYNLEKLDTPEEINKSEITLVALKGSTSEEFVKKLLPEAKLTLAKDYDEAVDLIATGKVKAMVADIEICQIAILQNFDKNLVTLEEPLTIEPVSMALPKNDFTMESFMSNYFTALRMVGALQALDAKWFEDGSWLTLVE
jgi:polar amino acid transport system substrate-binding protein